MSDDPQTPFWAKCKSCGHCWVAAYYPQALFLFAKILSRARCPKCGGDAVVAKQDDGKLLEDCADA